MIFACCSQEPLVLNARKVPTQSERDERDDELYIHVF